LTHIQVMRTSRLWIPLALQALLLASVYEAVGRVVPRLGLPLRDGVLVAAERIATRGALPFVAPTALPAWGFDAFSAAYVSYFALPVVLIAALARRRGAADAFAAVRVLLVAFYIHYALYAIVPAVGPSRTLELSASTRAAIAAEGGAATHAVRRVVGALEGPAPDAFPSAHTSIALLIAALARRHRVAGRWIIYPASAAIVASTVVLGYHYVVDVAAAVPVACVAWRWSVLKSPAAWRRADSSITSTSASCGPTPIPPASSGSASSSVISKTPRSSFFSGSDATARGCSTS